MADTLTNQKKLFVEYYVTVSKFNATDAARRAKYSEDTADSQGSRLLKSVKVKEYMKELITSLIPDRDEIILGNINFWLETRDDLNISHTDRLKASDLLGKYGAMFTEKIEHSGSVNMIVDNVPDSIN